MNEIENILENMSFQDPSWVLLIPFALMVVDVLTGVVHAWVTGHLKSYRMREGLGRKFGEIMILFIGEIFTAGLNFPYYILKAFSIYIMFMEVVSICENLKKLGVPIPKFVDKALESMNEIIQNGRKDETEVKDDGDGKPEN